MAGNIYTVTVTAGLIEKLAGIQKPQAAPTPSAPAGAPVPRALIHPEVLALRQQDQQLSRALASSRRVGTALLKAEEEELPKVKQLASELLETYAFPVRAVPCQLERDACIECYTANPKDPLKCASLVDAYAACAERAFEAQTRQQQ